MLWTPPTLLVAWGWHQEERATAYVQLSILSYAHSLAARSFVRPSWTPDTPVLKRGCYSFSLPIRWSELFYDVIYVCAASSVTEIIEEQPVWNYWFVQQESAHHSLLRLMASQEG